MLYLVLSILFMAGLGVSLGAGTRQGVSGLGLNAIFRLTGGVLGLATLLYWVEIDALPGLWAQAGPLALAAGLLYWLSGIAAIQAMRRGHLGVTWTITRCSVILPTLASIFYWREIAVWPISPLLCMRLAGLGMTLATVLLIGMDRKRPHPGDRSQPLSRSWVGWLALTFLAQGSWEIGLRVSATLTNEAERVFFISLVFITAAVLSLSLWSWRRPPMGRREFGFGILAGICGFLGSGLRPWALRDLKGVVVFPVSAVSVLLLVQAAATLMWGHRLGRWGQAALAAAIAAILLLTL